MEKSKKPFRLFLTLLMILTACSIQKTNAQTKSENKQTIAQAVREALSNQAFTIHVEQMYPQNGRARSLNSYFSLEIRNDTVFSNLPYFGVAYSAVLGSSKGLVFDATLSDLKIIPQKKGKTKVQFTTKNEEDVYTYTITLWENGSANIYVQPMRRQSISYLGRLEQ